LVLVVGASLRLLLIVGDWPTARRNSDVYPFATAAHGDLFSDPLHPAGYAIFLRVLHGVWASAFLPTLVQHVLGLVAGALLYDIARRLGAGRWWSALPAAVVVLSIDQIATEHLLMSDTFSGFLVVLAVWLIVRARFSPSAVWFSAASGAVAAAALTVRATGIVLVPLLVFAAWWRSGRLRWFSSLAVVGGLLLLLVPYFVVQHSETGRWSLTRSGGWSQYTRSAPFADCTRFTPPKGTEFLCEASSTDTRPGPDYYAWEGGPARAAYGSFLLGNEELSQFATAAIRAQPGDYVSDVLHDFSRFFLPINARHNPGGGSGPWAQSVSTLDPHTAETASAALEAYYGDLVPVRRTRILDFLARLQPYLRIGTIPLTGACLVALCGVILRRPRRGWVLFFLGIAFSTLFICVATATYTWRYALPVIPFAFLAASIAASELARPRRGPSSEARDIDEGPATNEPRDLVGTPT
jgi:hypothetical protein